MDDDCNEDAKTQNVADSSGVRVMAEMCATCVFRPGNLMHLPPGRLAGMIADATRSESTIVCHSTLDKEEQACCRGFFDKYATAPLQIAERLGFVVEHRIASDGD